MPTTKSVAMDQWLLHTLAAHSLDLIYAKDRDSRFLFANEALARTFGCESAEQLIGGSDFDFHPRELAEGYYRDDQSVIRSGQSIVDREEQLVDAATGERRWFSTTKIPLCDDAEQVIGIVGITRDITDSRLAQQRTRQLNETLEKSVAERTRELKELADQLDKERHLMRTLIDALPDNIYAKDERSRFLLANDAVARCMGTTPEELLGKDDFSFCPEPLAQQYFDDERQLLESGQGILEHEEPTLDHQTGRTRWLLTSKVPFHNSAGNVAGLVGIGRDISLRREAELALRDSEERFRSLTDLSSDWYWEQDAEGVFVGLTDPSGKSGFGVEEFLGRRVHELPGCEPLEGSWVALESALRERKAFRGIEVSQREGRYFSLSGLPVHDDEGQFLGFRGIGQDITERRRSQEQVHFLATHDSLTELPNRFMFHQILEVALNSAKRHGRMLAVLFIDLDRFKNINDTLGHDAGDELLKIVAQRFTDCLRSSDVVARLGGDEFVVLLQDIKTVQDASRLAKRLIEAAVEPVTVKGLECRVTASVGICIHPADADTSQGLMKNADIAMYRAKEEGKNTYQFYAPSIQARSLERLTLENQLRQALARNELFLHYQAKRHLGTGAVSGLEALVRWQHPELGVVPPGDFIPLAEETGLIVAIGRWVLDTACHQAAEWERQGIAPGCLAVNLSPRQFYDEHLIGDIRRALESSGLVPARLELEITESMVMQNADRAIEILRRIKTLGVRLAIDDFGVGYSSLAQIKRFPIDTLKVDGSFIRDIPANGEDRAITEAIIAMGRTLSLTVIAEGVETEEQEHFLRDHECDQPQGFYFSRPSSAEDIEAFLRAKKSNE